MGRSCRGQRSRYSVSSLLPYRALAIYRTQNAARVDPATGKYARYVEKDEREKEIQRLVITFIGLMNVPAIDRGGVEGEGVNASTENGKLGMYKLAYEYSSTSAPGQT